VKSRDVEICVLFGTLVSENERYWIDVSAFPHNAGAKGHTR
jgi:hypothetical protein